MKRKMWNNSIPFVRNEYNRVQHSLSLSGKDNYDYVYVYVCVVVLSFWFVCVVHLEDNFQC